MRVVAKKMAYVLKYPWTYYLLNRNIEQVINYKAVKSICSKSCIYILSYNENIAYGFTSMGMVLLTKSVFLGSNKYYVPIFILQVFW